MEGDSREFERLGYLHPRIQRHSIGEVQPELAPRDAFGTYRSNTRSHCGLLQSVGTQCILVRGDELQLHSSSHVTRIHSVPPDCNKTQSQRVLE